ncbi:MAG: SBBP repeat-containing protein, partial [Chloroflexi bacterium]|nr:SBBP repeat-containing protein [Chloroflexota bacterium]
AFVRKYDLSGNEIWTRQFGTARGEIAYGVAEDPTGFYVAGETYGTFPGQASAGEGDAFVRKYDLSGNEIWTRQFGTAPNDYASSIAAGTTGIYVAGRTYGTLAGQSSAGDADDFVRKYDSGGNEIWTRQFGTASYDRAYAIAVDATGVYVAGMTNSGTFPDQAVEGGVFVRRYDSNGNEVWTRQFLFGTTSGCFDIAADSTGVYIVGITDGAVPGQVSAGDLDVFARKYDSAGNEVWTRQLGTTTTDWARGIAVDATGVYVAGRTDGIFPGQTSLGGSDAFLVKLAGLPPVANNQSVATNEDTAKAITLTAADADGDALTYAIVAQPSHGSLSGMLPNVIYTPALNYNGSDNFTFKANDGKADSNIATISITVNAVSDPDLNMEDVKISPKTAKPGDIVTVSFKVKNQSDIAAGPSSVGAAIVPKAGGPPIVTGSVSIGPVPAWGTSPTANVTLTLPLPPVAALGQYRVVLTADAQNEVPEDNEGNNVAVYEFLTVTLPDLNVDSMSFTPKTAMPGDNVTVTFKIRNGSDLGAPPTIAHVAIVSMLFPPGPPDPPALVVVPATIGPIAAWGSVSESVSLTLPANTTPGQYRVVVRADAPGTVPEINETNNLSRLDNLTVQSSQ